MSEKPFDPTYAPEGCVAVECNQDLCQGCHWFGHDCHGIGIVKFCSRYLRPDGRPAILKRKEEETSPWASLNAKQYRRFDVNNNAICEHCEAKTKQPYASYPRTECWKCGRWMLPLNPSKVPKTAEPQPGQIWFDATGRISSGTPATYVLLSADLVEKLETKWEWRAARFRKCGDGWRGAPIIVLWDSDIEKLEYIGDIPLQHMWRTE